VTRLLFALAAVLAIVLATSRDARAQAAQLKATVDAQTVEVGDTLAYSLQATTSDGPEPRDAQPGPTAGFQVRMTASGPMHSVTIVNGVQTVSRGLTTTWTLHAERTGTFTLGPASVSIGGARRAANPVRVRRRGGAIASIRGGASSTWTTSARRSLRPSPSTRSSRSTPRARPSPSCTRRSTRGGPSSASR
jgi:hypothetical protein